MLKANAAGEGTRTALQNAASIAGLMITSEAMVAEAPKKDKPAMGGGGGTSRNPEGARLDLVPLQNSLAISPL